MCPAHCPQTQRFQPVPDSQLADTVAAQLPWRPAVCCISVDLRVATRAAHSPSAANGQHIAGPTSAAPSGRHPDAEWDPSPGAESATSGPAAELDPGTVAGFDASSHGRGCDALALPCTATAAVLRQRSAYLSPERRPHGHTGPPIPDSPGHTSDGDAAVLPVSGESLCAPHITATPRQPVSEPAPAGVSRCPLAASRGPEGVGADALPPPDAPIWAYCAFTSNTSRARERGGMPKFVLVPQDVLRRHVADVAHRLDVTSRSVSVGSGAVKAEVFLVPHEDTTAQTQVNMAPCFLWG